MAEMIFQFPKTFEWKITDFDLWPSLSKKPICSPEFDVESGKFYLALYPKGYEEKGDGTKYASIYLVRKSCDYGPKYLFVEFKITLFNDEYFPSEYYYASRESFKNGTRKGRKYFIDSDLLELVEDPFENSLLIKCEYAVDDDEGINYSFRAPNNNDFQSLSNDYAQSLQKSLHCDLYLKSSDGISYKVHRVIIMSRCPTLLQSSDTQENRDKEVALRINSPTLHFLLKYIYSGKVDIRNTESVQYDVLHRYGLLHLQQLIFPLLPIGFASTKVPLIKASFTWVIPRFSTLSKSITLTKSLCYHESLMEWTKIKVSLDIKQNDSNKNYLRFSMQTMASEESVRMLCKIYILDPNDTQEYEGDLKNGVVWNITYPISIEFLKMKDCLKDDILKVFFEFEMSSDGRCMHEMETTHGSEVAGYQTASNLWVLQKDLKRLYKSKKYSDVTLCLGDKKWRVHKVVLSVRSPEFLNVFEHDKLKGQANLVLSLKDITEQVVEAMLSYIYCGELKEEPKDIMFAFDLYMAADTYKILLLKEKCISFISRVLDAESVGTLLSLAHLYCDQSLKRLVKDFVSFNVYEILNSNEWNETMQEILDIAEGKQNIVLATRELGSSVIINILWCIYCGEIDYEQNEIDSAITLYELANKYQLFYLKRECVLFFGRVINPKNIGKLFKLVDVHEDEALKTCVENFVIYNMDNIINSDEWKTVMKVETDLTEDMKNIALNVKIIEASTLLSLLSYIYGEKLDIRRKDLNSLTNLYSNAKKYGLKQLTKECVKNFELIISAENVGKLLVLSDTHNDEALGKCVKDFVASNVDKILESDKWKRKMQENWDTAEDMQNIAEAAKVLGPEIVITILFYVYCKKLGNEQEGIASLMKLYENANKYKILRLKEKCISLLCTMISEENVGKLLKLSDAHGDESLRKCIEHFVSSNAEKILDSSELKEIIAERPDLVEDLRNVRISAVISEELGPQIAMALLSYVYCGNLGKEKDINSVMNLYRCAEKYKLPQLKQGCIHFLNSELTVRNIYTILQLADTYNDECLKKCAYDFICSNAAEILNSDEWQNVTNGSPRIVRELQRFALLKLAKKT